NSFVFFKVKDEGVYIISLFAYANNTENSVADIIDVYNKIITQIKWNFIKEGYRNINVLHVIISDNISLAKEFIKDSDTYWIINESTDQLVIFENQKSEFLDVKENIEQVLDCRDSGYSSIYQDGRVSDGILNKLKKMLSNMSGMMITCCILFMNVVIFIIMDWSYDWSVYNSFVEQGGISYDTIIHNHQYYRFLTHMFLHADINHLFGNMLVLFFIGTQVEKRIGSFRYTILYFVGGIVAAVTSLGYNRLHDSSMLSIGASGAIFAIVGALVVIIIFNRNEFAQIGLQRLLFFVALTIFSGMNTQGIDNAAHVGGLLAGLVLGQVLYLGAKNKGKNNYS
ncbi:rhomboid family intramembrane serine protease, partial [Anaerosporobacter sp.]